MSPNTLNTYYSWSNCFESGLCHYLDVKGMPSEKITELNDENRKIIENYPPNIIYVYSLRSAESFNSIVANYSLAPMMTQSAAIVEEYND